jgi:hypothetical protein
MNATELDAVGQQCNAMLTRLVFWSFYPERLSMAKERLLSKE